MSQKADGAMVCGSYGSLLRPQAGGEGWVRGALHNIRAVAHARGVAPSTRTVVSPQQCSRKSDRRALRAPSCYSIGAGA